MVRKAGLELQRQWRDRLERFSRSKLSVAEFCRREKVSVPSFYQWRKKLAATGRHGHDVRPTTKATFIPVQVAAGANLQVTFPNGTRLTLPAVDHEIVKLSIAAIASADTTTGDA
jgi:transposase